MRPASTFILSSANPHALAGFPTELKPCVDEALQEPKIFRKILTNKKIATNPQFVDMITTKMGKEHPALLLDAMTQPVVLESLEEINPRLAHKIAMANSQFAVDENIEAIYENASANLLKLASRQDPEALLEFATESNIFPILAVEDNTLPSDLANIFEEEFGELGTLDDGDESLIRDLREMSGIILSGESLGYDTLGFWSRVKKAAKKVVRKVKSAVKRVKKKAKKLYTRAKTAVRKTYNKAKNKASRAYKKAKTYAHNKAKNVVKRARQVRDVAVRKAKAAKAAVQRKVAETRKAVRQKVAKVKAVALQKAVELKKRIADTRAKMVKIAKAKLEAAKKRVRDIGIRIKASKAAAIEKSKKLWTGIKTGVSKRVTKAKNLVGNAAKKYNEYKAAAIKKAQDAKKKVDDLKAAIRQRADERIRKTKEYLAKRAQAAFDKAKGLKDWSKQKLSGAMTSAGNVMRSGSNLLKTGKDMMVGAGKKALTIGLGAARAAGSSLLGAGKVIGKALATPWTAAFGLGYKGAEALSNYLGSRGKEQEEAEQEPEGMYEEPIGPEEMEEMGEMYSPGGAGMEGYPEEEPYPGEEPYPEEELPPGMECKEGEEMPEEQMVCISGKWSCKPGAKIEIEPGFFMRCINGEWTAPPAEPGEPPIGEDIPEGWEAGLPEGHVCKIGDREELAPGVFMECVDGQWRMPGEPGMPVEPVEPGVPGMPPVDEYMPPEEEAPAEYMPHVPGEEYMPPEEEAPAEYMPHVPGEEWSPAEEGGYVAPEIEDMAGLPEEIREEIADEIQDVTIPEAEEWSEEGPVPGTVVPKPETGLPQIPVPIFNINIAKMVGWTGRTVEFQEIIPGVRPTPIPWVIPQVNDIPVIGPMISSTIDKIPLLPGFIVRGEDGKVENEGMRLPTIPRSLVGLPAIPIPEQLAKPDYGYEEVEEAELGYRGPPRWMLGGDETGQSLSTRSRGYPFL